MMKPLTASVQKSGSSPGVSWLLTLCITAIALTNSLSVSGPNNPWVAPAVLFAILFAGNSQRELEAKKKLPDLPLESS